MAATWKQTLEIYLTNDRDNKQQQQTIEIFEFCFYQYVFDSTFEMMCNSIGVRPTIWKIYVTPSNPFFGGGGYKIQISELRVTLAFWVFRA